MGSVIFEAVPGSPSRVPGTGYYDASIPAEWLVNFRVPRAGNDGGTLAVVQTQEAATALARVLNYATATHDQAALADAA